MLSLLLSGLFSSCGEWGLLSSYCAQASRCSGFSCSWASVVMAHGLSDYGFQVLEHRFNSCGA